MQSRLATPAISLCVAISFMAAPSYSTAQQTEGDQFLDGIGETALVARFIFDGNVQDSSRHQRHGSFHGASEAYVDDDIFGQVLSLTGGKGGFVQLRGDVLVGLDSISITGWVYLRGESAGQRFFDCGQGTTAYFFCSPIGANAEEGMHARITKSGSKYEQGPISQRIVNKNKWVHLAVVLDATTKTLTTYADGKPVGQASDVELTLEDVLSQDNAEENLVYLGKSQFEADETIDANLHDVRIYSVALTAQQVATINRNALSDGSVVLSGRSTQPRADIGSTARPSVVVANVAEVPDVQVTTVAGHVPRIPLAIPVIYRDGSKGPDVRVVWPAPRDNEQTLTTGVYTVTGVIPGTDLRPKAIITVVRKAEAEISAPNRLLEAFPLGQIVLNVDEQGRETPFIQNRDKFIHVLLETDPDAFLYMFRDAFGQEQPEGAEPLGGVGQPDNAAARPRQRSLSDCYCTSLRQHHLR